MKAYNTLRQPYILIPLVVFFMAKVFAFFLAIQGNCLSVFGPNCWVRWDSALYLDIAQNGHSLFMCGPDQGYSSISTTDWCGNAGWAPLYPWLIRILSATTGMATAIAGIILSTIFFFSFLLVCSKLVDIKTFNIRNWLILTLIAFCPGNIYFHAVFPLSLVAFLLSLFFFYLKNESYLKAGLAGFLAVLSYSIGFFLIAVIAAYGLVLFFKSRDHFLKFSLQCGIITVAGLLVLFVYDFYSTGHWDAVFLIQSKYGHGLNSPLKLLGQHWQKLVSESWSIKSWIEIQNLFMVFYVTFAALFILLKQKGNVFRFFHIFFLMVFWFIPLGASFEVALYRNAAVLGPGHSFLTKAPLWLLGMLLMIFMILSYFMGILFIQSILV